MAVSTDGSNYFIGSLYTNNSTLAIAKEDLTQLLTNALGVGNFAVSTNKLMFDWRPNIAQKIFTGTIPGYSQTMPGSGFPVDYARFSQTLVKYETTAGFNFARINTNLTSTTTDNEIATINATATPGVFGGVTEFCWVTASDRAIASFLWNKTTGHRLFVWCGATVPPKGQSIPTNGLKLWLDATDRNTLVTSGTSVTQWNDKSGNGNNAVTATGLQNPQLSNSELVFNGNSALRYSTPSFSGAAPRSVICLVKIPSLVNRDQWLFSNGSATTNNIFAAVVPTNSRVLSITSFGGTNVANSPSNVFQLGTWHVFSVYYDGAIAKGYIDNQLVVQYNNVINTNGTVPSLIGDLPGFADRGLIGSMREFIVYDRPLTDAERTQVYNSMVAKLSGNSSSSTTSNNFPYPANCSAIAVGKDGNGVKFASAVRAAFPNSTTAMQVLTSGKANYAIACADGQTPIATWTTDLYLLDNDPPNGDPATGRCSNLLLARGTFEIGKFYKLKTPHVDGGSENWICVAEWGTDWILMRTANN